VGSPPGLVQRNSSLRNPTHNTAGPPEIRVSCSQEHNSLSSPCVHGLCLLCVGRAVVVMEGMGRPPNGSGEQFLSGRLCLVYRNDVGRFDENDEPVRAPLAEHVPDAGEHVAGGSQFTTDGPVLHSPGFFVAARNFQSPGVWSHAFVSAGVDGQNSSRK
jgi:hypothetical protein